MLPNWCNIRYGAKVDEVGDGGGGMSERELLAL